MATVGTRSSTAACTNVISNRSSIFGRGSRGAEPGAVEVGVDVGPADQQQPVGVGEQAMRGLRIQLPRRHDQGLAAGAVHGIEELDAGVGHRVPAGDAGPGETAGDDDAGRHALRVEP
jgi:hypothetical protein